MTTEKAEPDTLLPCVDEIAAQVHEGRFSEGHAQINYNTFADEYSDGQQYCRRIARKLLEKFQIRRRAAPPRCDAQSEALREALQKIADLVDSEEGEPLDDAIRIANAALSETKPAQGEDSMNSRLNYGPLDYFGPEDTDTGTAFIIHNVDDTVTIKVRSPGDRVFSEVEMPQDAWLKLRSVGAPRCDAQSVEVSAISDEAMRELLSSTDVGQRRSRLKHILRALAETEPAQASARCDAQSVWEPTEAQLNSACLSYDHSFGMMPEDERNMLRFQAREWLRAWQKEGAGADRREIIEECAAIVDQANREGPYQAISAASRIRALSGTKPAPAHRDIGI